MKYLYGASVNGIQQFIFTTNKLREIVGASEIVKGIAKSFDEKIKGKKVIKIVNAAGNIKAVFEKEEELEEFINDFSKSIFKKAYGITLSQAVVAFEGDEKKYINELEQKLKSQRNISSIPIDSGFSIAKFSPTTSKMGVVYKDDKVIDKATLQKLDKYSEWFREKRKEIPNFKDLTNNEVLANSKKKIAIIHIDGNGLGNLIPELESKYKLKIEEFSKKLDETTKEAFKKAKEGNEYIRDVILGGDDVTVICNANEALSFTKRFLEYFEEGTSKIFNGKNRLTAGAGIVYCNMKFPFHYAVSLAEELVSEAKNRSKREHSCLMFHNIQASFFEDYDYYIEKELTINGIRLDYGPYYLNKSPKIEDFINVVRGFSQKGSPISRLREWLKEISFSKTYSNFMLKRIEDITRKKGIFEVDAMNNNLKKLDDRLSLTNLIVDNKSPVYDVINLLSVIDGVKND